MKERADFDKIFDRHGKLIGVLNYNLMIPVQEKHLIKINLKINPNDSQREKIIPCNFFALRPLY